MQIRQLLFFIYGHRILEVHLALTQEGVDRYDLAVPYARLLQLEERTVLEIVKCGFKSHVGYQIGLEVGISSSTINFLLNLAEESLPK